MADFYTPQSLRFASALALLALASCAGNSPTESEPGVDSPVDTFAPGHEDDTPFDPFGPTSCDASIEVRADGPSLMVRDPAVLAGFPLERVLTQLLAKSEGGANLGPHELLQRMFDTENDAANAVFPDGVHCDDEANLAFANAPAVECPRAEGKLAKSQNFFTAGHPDSFVPVAIVNRFDLTPTDMHTCGEHRIVFAKRSGLTDPNDRVFLIFEGALAAPQIGFPDTCLPVAKAWQSLEGMTVAEQAAKLEEIFFTGLPDMNPVVHPLHYGLLANDDDPYEASRGQIRLSQRMQDPWEMREFRLAPRTPDTAGPTLVINPVTVKNNALPSLFDTANGTKDAIDFRANFAPAHAGELAAADLVHIRMHVENSHNAGESAFGGQAQTDYLSRVKKGKGGQAFLDEVNEHIGDNVSALSCPPGDPLTAESLVNRAASQTCAGCHAPEQFIGPGRKLGCGLVWPASLGNVHIDERGDISPALRDVLLPRRAFVMSTLLQNCDQNLMWQSLEPGSNVIPK